MSLQEEDNQIKFSLNHELAQCKSKTNTCLTIMAQLHHTNEQKYKYSETKKIKLISIVFTNNSLLEVKAWNDRTLAKFNEGNLIVKRLASDVDKNSGNFTKGDELLLALIRSGSNNFNSDKILGDILIMCNHPTRISNIIEMIETSNRLGFKKGESLKFNIFFDECDDRTCLSNMNTFVEGIYNQELNNLIDEIQLITATPTEEMQKKLINITPHATKLLNIKKRLLTQESVCLPERIKDYKTILDHKFIPFEGSADPIDYVNELASKKPEIFIEGKIYFIPASHYCSEHNKMASLELFKKKGYWVLILNGKEKGFTNPLGIEEPLDLKMDGELRDILREWRRKNPTAGLVITGNKVLERGLTFLTNGFCFDYMIVSPYHARKLTSMIQILGRGQGNDKFVGNITLITTQFLYDSAKKYIKDTEKILEEGPDYYDHNMLSKIGKVNKFSNVTDEMKDTIEELCEWIKENLRTKNGGVPRTDLKSWRKKNKDENGFILHNFRKSGEKVWSYDEAKEEKGGLQRYSRRIFPCYTDLNDVTTLKWCVLYWTS